MIWDVFIALCLFFIGLPLAIWALFWLISKTWKLLLVLLFVSVFLLLLKFMPWPFLAVGTILGLTRLITGLPSAKVSASSSQLQ
jgi:hypothetical protein